MPDVAGHTQQKNLGPGIWEMPMAATARVTGHRCHCPVDFLSQPLLPPRCSVRVADFLESPFALPSARSAAPVTAAPALDSERTRFQIPRCRFCRFRDTHLFYRMLRCHVSPMGQELGRLDRFRGHFWPRALLGALLGHPPLDRWLRYRKSQTRQNRIRIVENSIIRHIRRLELNYHFYFAILGEP